MLVAYLVGFLLHAVAIWLLPLYLAQATIAMSATGHRVHLAPARPSG